jgi:hypothetical protein
MEILQTLYKVYPEKEKFYFDELGIFKGLEGQHLIKAEYCLGKGPYFASLTSLGINFLQEHGHPTFIGDSGPRNLLIKWGELVSDDYSKIFLHKEQIGTIYPDIDENLLGKILEYMIDAGWIQSMGAAGITFHITDYGLTQAVRFKKELDLAQQRKMEKEDQLQARSLLKRILDFNDHIFYPGLTGWLPNSPRWFIYSLGTLLAIFGMIIAFFDPIAGIIITILAIFLGGIPKGLHELNQHIY